MTLLPSDNENLHTYSLFSHGQHVRSYKAVFNFINYLKMSVEDCVLGLRDSNLSGEFGVLFHAMPNISCPLLLLEDPVGRMNARCKS
jgi:hypothetical protein